MAAISEVSGLLVCVPHELELRRHTGAALILVQAHDV